jgi:hypothetical protein
MKKILHLLKTEPDDMQRTLMDSFSKGETNLEIPLYEKDGNENVDYDEIIDLIFEYDQVIAWW